MARIKGAMMTRKRRNKVLKLAKGYWGKCISVAVALKCDPTGPKFYIDKMLIRELQKQACVTVGEEAEAGIGEGVVIDGPPVGIGLI